MNITAEMKMADVIHYNYILLPVITRFGIELGFGDKTVKEVCHLYHVNLEFFLEITNSFVDDDYVPQKELESFSLNLIVDYLKKTHNYYLEEKIPELEKMILKMVHDPMDQEEKNSLIKNFFTQYKIELTTHIEKEEDKIQPYVLKLEEAWRKKTLSDELYTQIKKYSIDDFATEHDNVEEKLYDLKNIIIKYLPPCKDRSLCNKILMELFRLEKDLNAHAALEDKVLIPKVSEMERILIAQYEEK